ncbi:MAG: hypothetical protein WBA31_04545 [Candidatus Dormiibacterota bacterium]
MGAAQCQASAFADGSVDAQVAVRMASCQAAATVAARADKARGAPYQVDGYSCTANKEGTGSAWASAWAGTYYAYSCANGSDQVAFTWGTNYTYGSGAASASPLSSPTSGRLQPAPVGYAQCDAQRFQDNSVAAQIAVADTTCATAATVEKQADTAQGDPYSLSGFSCTATSEGAGSTWASAWGGTYYAYSCRGGSSQVAFNWGTDYTY